jgi:hypothetical protein
LGADLAGVGAGANFGGCDRRAIQALRWLEVSEVSWTGSCENHLTVNQGETR